MKWYKKALIRLPDSRPDWIHSHAMIPSPILLEDRIRVYTSFCDQNMRARVGFIDLDKTNPENIITYSKQPILDLGEPGCFDQDGVVQCSIIQEQDRILMFYVGFERCTEIRYRLFTGLAISTDGGLNFTRVQKTPVLDRTDSELFFRCGPYVKKEQDLYKLWYVAGSTWIEHNNKSLPVYSIKYLESTDPQSWTTEGKPCLDIDQSNSQEHGFGRPFYYENKNRRFLFYCIRDLDSTYRLGYAEANNNDQWQRKDNQINFENSLSDFDSHMQCYPSLIEVNGQVLMFYNGNGFGKDGFAIAELSELD